VTAPTRPVLRYHGGKFRKAPWIIGHFKPHRVYVEPYGGGASVLMRKPRADFEVYNDLDGDVVNVFRVLRDRRRSRALEQLLRLTPWARAEFELSYEASDDPVERARRTIVRCFMGHGTTSRRKNRTGFRAGSHACPLYDEELVGAWERDSTAARGDRGTARIEVVWIKPSGVTMPAPVSLVQPSFLEASNG
jgi:DNA adenine methylase